MATALEGKMFVITSQMIVMEVAMGRQTARKG